MNPNDYSKIKFHLSELSRRSKIAEILTQKISKDVNNIQSYFENEDSEITYTNREEMILWDGKQYRTYSF